MLALATTHDGDIPIFLRPLDGNSSDKEYLSATVREVMTQLRIASSETVLGALFCPLGGSTK